MDAVRLIAAVQDHAARLGLRTPGLTEPGIPWVEDYLRRFATRAANLLRKSAPELE